MKKYTTALCAVWVASTSYACQGTIGNVPSEEQRGGGGRNGGGGGLDGDGDGDGDVGGDGFVGGDGGNGGAGNAMAVCNAPTNAGAGTWRRLTASQYQATVRDLLGLTPDMKGFLLDTTTGPFATNAPLPAQDADIAKYGSSAEALAVQAISNLPRLLDCDPKVKGEDVCATQFITNFGARAFRRPLTTSEITSLKQVYAIGKEESFTAGIRLVVEATLQSPSFLYLVEKGEPQQDGLLKLTGYEIAARLAYMLTGTMPDATLVAAAKAGKLDDKAGLQAAADTLIRSDKFLVNAARFHTQLLGVEALSRSGVVTKEAAKYPTFTDAMRAAMVEEPSRFVAYLMNNDRATVEDLLTAPYVFPSGPLETLYGRGSPGADGRLEITDGSRMGLLGLAGVQASHPAVPTHYGAVVRGHLIRRELLCETIPPPLQAVTFETPPNADQMTPQELLREHQENPTCKGCHALMDPIGFGFEKFDLLGRIRDKNPDGTALDLSGEIVGLENDGQFQDTNELITKLATAPEVRKCLGTQWFRFALARDPQPEDACAEASVQQALATGKGDIRSAVMSLISSDAFRYRRGE